MQLLLKIDSKCDKQNENLNNKFNELKSEIHEQKVKCESNFSELKNQINEIKLVRVSFARVLDIRRISGGKVR